MPTKTLSKTARMTEAATAAVWASLRRTVSEEDLRRYVDVSGRPDGRLHMKRPGEYALWDLLAVQNGPHRKSYGWFYERDHTEAHTAPKGYTFLPTGHPYNRALIATGLTIRLSRQTHRKKGYWTAFGYWAPTVAVKALSRLSRDEQSESDSLPQAA